MLIEFVMMSHRPIGCRSITEKLILRFMFIITFYRAMHFSTKRGLAIACPFVGAYVRNVGGL